MLTRGHIIGKIIDDLSTLDGQIAMRCSVNLLDLNRFCEDFFKEILNIGYGLSLTNLNADRSNEPGLDLGDTGKKIAYQVTSVTTSQKVSQTLSKITEEQQKKFTKFKVLILGKKQTSYDAIDKSLMAKFGFELSDIVDISDLCSKIVTLKFEQLFELYKLFEREMQIVMTEIEIPNRNGEYKTSISSQLEVAPNTICLNAGKFLAEYDTNSLPKITKEFKKLGRLPRITRDFLEALVTACEQDGGTYRMPYIELKRKLRIPEKELQEEIQILVDHEFLRDPGEEAEIFTRFSDTLFDIIDFSKAHGNLKKVLVALDFTLLDNPT